MRINIRTYGNVVTVDGESHVVDKNLTAMFPGVASITYDHETGVGHVEYTPTPSHTFYGMDGLKGLSDVLAGWNKESDAVFTVLEERLTKMDADIAEMAKLDPEEPGVVERLERTKEARAEFAARIERHRTPDTALADRVEKDAALSNMAARAPVVIEDF